MLTVIFIILYLALLLVVVLVLIYCKQPKPKIIVNDYELLEAKRKVYSLEQRLKKYKSTLDSQNKVIELQKCDIAKLENEIDRIYQKQNHYKEVK